MRPKCLEQFEPFPLCECNLSFFGFLFIYFGGEYYSFILMKHTTYSSIYRVEQFLFAKSLVKLNQFFLNDQRHQDRKSTHTHTYHTSIRKQMRYIFKHIFLQMDSNQSMKKNHQLSFSFTMMKYFNCDIRNITGIRNH